MRNKEFKTLLNHIKIFFSYFILIIYQTVILKIQNQKNN
jgi:hypothetical protein